MSEETTAEFDVPVYTTEETVSVSKDDFNNFRIQVLIGISTLSALLLILIISISILFCQYKKLQRLVTVLDPMRHYKKVSKSTYLKKHDRASISSSFHVFNTSWENLESDNSKMVPKVAIKKRSSGLAGTLDRNYFSRSDFQFENPLSRPGNLEEEVGGHSQNSTERAQSDRSQPPNQPHIAQHKLFY